MRGWLGRWICGWLLLAAAPAGAERGGVSLIWFAAALPLASRWYPAEHQGTAMGIAGAGNSGTALAALFAPVQDLGLIVIDEAGQLELRWLPEEVSTIAGLGGMFVTGWQSRAQINHRYGSLADAVLGGHRSKVIFNGTDDLATLEYVSKVAGTEHVAQRGWSADTGGGRRTVSEHLQREALLPAHVIRQMRRQEAVLLHGTLPPIHLRPPDIDSVRRLVRNGDGRKTWRLPTTRWRAPGRSGNSKR